jgi:hypothetical protein
VLKLNGDRAAVRIPVPGGRRRELVPDRPPVNAKTGLLERLLPVLLGQSPPGRGISWRALPAAIAPGSPLPGVAAPGIAAGPAGISAVTQAAALAGPGLAVGYQPIIEEIPQGVTMTAAAVVSNDLRYVRLAINPSFVTITDVFTFTFVGGGH